MKVFVAALCTLAASLLVPPGVHAQIRASEPAMMQQTIDGTVITIEYFRPRARGRAPLFGHDAVVWEEIWTPGANWATSLEFQRPIELDGVKLEPGKYGVWMKMSAAHFLPETLVLEPYVRRFHTNPPAVPSDDQITLPVDLTEASHQEMMTWDFEEIRPNGGTLSLRWGTTRMAFDVRVELSMRLTVTDEEAAPVLGEWEVQFEGPDGPGAGGTLTLEMADNETLRGDFEGVEGTDADAFFNRVELQLMYRSEGIFQPGEVYGGELREVWQGVFMEFEIVDGRAVSFVARDQDDQIFMKGSR